MVNPLKNIYDQYFISGFAEMLHKAHAPFNKEKFVSSVMDKSWDSLELRARMKRIVEVLGSCLPERYEDALEILFSIDEMCVGFPYLFFPDFVSTYGLSEIHWDISMNALERFTRRSSSEFAIRHFILKDPERTMYHMRKWALSSSDDVRRFASEGCRPRLPWGISLPIFKKDPGMVFSVIEILKNDPSEYVRRSVANNLNDISKDNPDIVIGTVKRWKGKSKNTDWIIRHACRGLVRKAVPEIMGVFGYSDVPVFEKIEFSITPSVSRIGDTASLGYSLTLPNDGARRIRVEYGIYFIKANGSCSRKLFLLSDRITEGTVTISSCRKIRWIDLTTRKHYPGKHKVVLLVNGNELSSVYVDLKK